MLNETKVYISLERAMKEELREHRKIKKALGPYKVQIKVRKMLRDVSIE